MSGTKTGTKTQAELVQVTLQNLGVLAAGQSVAAEDSDLIVLRLEPKAEELNNRNICWISDLDNIDNAMFLPFADIMAAECATVFNVSAPKKQALMALAARSEQTLKDVVRLRGTRKNLQTDYPVQRGYRRTW